jgi:hypothetical protein
MDRVLACFGKRRRRVIEQDKGFVGEGIEVETSLPSANTFVNILK